MVEQLEFRISSGLKNIIGKELITDDFIAIFELVKNSYDAEAKNVDIIFQNIKKDTKNARIIIRDDGYGMSRRDLESKWLFVGYSEKKEFESKLANKDFRDKIGARRIFAGAKGIGRFSCDRLGSKLLLYTKTKKEKRINKLSVDWQKFEEDSTETFQSIKVDYEPLENIDVDYVNFPTDSGTLLVISNLNNKWNRKNLLMLKRRLQRLINPSHVQDHLDFIIYLEALEFEKEDQNIKLKLKSSPDVDREIVNGIVRNVVFEKLGIRTTHISTGIDENGKKITTKLTDKGVFIFKLEEKNPYPKLRNIQVELFYLNRSAKTTFSRIMGIPIVRYGSIFLYKNGFKINPYGNEGDDWLQLERRKGQGYARFLATRELMGRMEVLGDQPGFVEVSSRDGGVMDSPELEELHKFFMNKTLRRLEKYVVEGIDWDREKKPKDVEEIKRDSLQIINSIVGTVDDESKIIEFNENLLDIISEKRIEKLPEVIKNVEFLKKYVRTKDEKNYIDSQIKAIKTATQSMQSTIAEQENVITGLETEVETKEKELHFVTVLSDDESKKIKSLQHQIKNATSIINRRLKKLSNVLDKNEQPDEKFLRKLIDTISKQTQIVSSIVLFVTKAKFNVMTEVINQDLISFIREYTENVYAPYSITVMEKDISIIVDSDPNDTFIRRFRPLDIVVIIDNLIDNSIKAKSTEIKITLLKPNENELQVRIRDNGRGIPKKYRDNIFEFGFSTTDGSGIGLYHIKNILNIYKGNISFNPDISKGAEFIVEVPK